jgi:hypothetical protein
MTQYKLTTDQFARLNGVKGQSVRARVCRVNHYFDVNPLKLANGRLLWPEVRVVSESGRTVAMSTGVAP